MDSLLNRFDALNLGALESYIHEQQEENLVLDFKTLRDSDLRSRDERKIVAAALSGFANSEGGLLVWGVDARPGHDRHDCAQALKPIGDVSRLVARLNSLTNELVSPVVDGVQHRCIHREADGSGYAATLVPRSDAGPHMAKGGEDRYFKRSGDSFVRLEHFDVADMFGRRVRPLLSIEFQARRRWSRPAGEQQQVGFEIVGSVRNDGRGSAIAPYVAVRISKPYKLNMAGLSQPWVLRLLATRNGWNQFAGTMNDVIHPSTSLNVFAVEGEAITGVDPDGLTINYEWAAEGTPLQRGEALFSGAEISSDLL